jgi:hypothetical protein
MSSTKLIQFFATLSDLESGFRSIESKCQLLVAEEKYYDNESIPVVESLFSIPNIGKVNDRRAPRYLVQTAGKKFKPTRVVQVGRKKAFPPKLANLFALVGIKPPGGKVVYDLQQVKHPSSITFSPGGFWNDETLVAGEVATIHDTSDSMKLYHLFRKELLSGFTSVHSFHVGPEALDLLKSGNRLTIDVKAGKLLDLALE